MGWFGKKLSGIFATEAMHLNSREAESAIFDAARGNDVATLRKMEQAGHNIITANDTGLTPLMIAVQENSIATVHLLLGESGANINIARDSGWTALMDAAHRGNRPMVTMLLEYGADPKLRTDNNTGRSASDWAEMAGHELLARHLANPDNVKTPLPQVTVNNSVKVLKPITFGKKPVA